MLMTLLLVAVLSIATSSQSYGDKQVNDRTVEPSTTTPAGQAPLDHLFTAVLEFQSDSPADAVVPAAGRQGAYIGSGEASVEGRLQGSMRWSFYSANCLFPQIRQGQKVPDDLHLCTVNPAGFIETQDGARISFDGNGYGLRSAERYLVSMTMVFNTEDARYAWLNRELGVMEGELDEGAGHSTWNVYVPRR